ncbi:hypothetical protein ETAA8_34330 [Anatilimnocola aggregata]|uniref:Uncharacterized protein n=1 Tax=Anatilimnocola aggregata TaxID=2528021 RepID=A0A517YDM5_9BACT|nr:hypothetical protein [Anatilimnocola aggregata]QDU28333.1 hypothetical protein ETAA8_34330 [Anatilimnocola aggregata]
MGSQSENTEVDQLLLNARLRDELEPFLDESVDVLACKQLPTSDENEFLASMLAWERAPALPIAQWFNPPLQLASPERLSDDELRERLTAVIEKLSTRRIYLELTDHLSDRQLYCLIARDILPSHEKMIDLPHNYLNWRCLDADLDAETWLAYYATDEERDMWSAENSQPMPAMLPPPYPRDLPRKLDLPR